MPAHRVTESQLFKVLRKREVRDGFEASELSSRVSAVVNEVWPVLQQVSRSFPLYTLHDPEHSFRVAQNMARLIPENTLANLDGIELSILIYSAYLHDIGMASSQDEFYSWIESDEYRAFVASHDKWAYALEAYDHEMPDELTRKQKKQGKRPAKQLKEDNRDIRLRKLQDVIYTDFLRENHATRGARYVIDNYGANGSSDNKIQIGEVNYAESIALVCKSHWDNANLLRNTEYRRDSYIGNLPANLQYCSVILRLADLVDLDPERTPKVLLDFIHFDLQNPNISKDAVEQSTFKSAEEWAKHRSVLGYKLTPDEIRIEAKCSHPAIQRGLREWCEYIDAERRDCRLIVQDNKKEITDKYVLGLANDVRKDFIESDGSFIYTDFRFQLDYDRIVTLLMGTELWGDPSVVFRELLQNALDACQHRLALSERLGVPYKPRISFHLTEPFHNRERQAILTCTDNGTGMNQSIIENFLMRIGRSYYNSPDFRRQNLDIFPISQFGLGIMSCFMLTNRVQIETQHVDESLRKDPPLSVQIDSSGRYVILSPLKGSREGTSVSLIFDFRGEEFRRHRHRDFPFDHPMMFFEMPEHVLSSLARHLDIPIEISYDEHHTHTIEPGAFTIPDIEWAKMPCMRERYHEFIFKFVHNETEGLAGVFRFLFPKSPDGKISFGLPVESRFKMFVDPDGDLCLTTPDYKDKRLELDYGLPDDWQTDEVRGIYRDRFGRKPPASEERYGDADSDVLEIVKSSFRWSQDGLLVGLLDTPWKGQERKSDSKNQQVVANLFEHVPVPGLNAADLDIRGLWRVSLNVQRSDFVKRESLDSFVDRYYSLAARMWKEILSKLGILSDLQNNRELLNQLLERSDWRLRAHLTKSLGYRKE